MTVDELVVTLELDPSKWTEGQRKALDEFKKTDEEIQKRLKSLEARNKSVGYSFGDSAKAAEGLFTAIAGAGMAKFAVDTVNSVAATGRMATNIGVVSTELQALGKVIERNGGSADSANASLKGYADTIQNWKMGKGSPDFLMGLTQIGGADLNASPLEIIEKLAKFAESHNAQEVNQTGARLGMSQDIINSVLAGTAKFNREYAESLKLVSSPEQVRKLTEAQDAWARIGQSFRAVGNDIVSDVAPAFSWFDKLTFSFVTTNRKYADSLGWILTGFTALSAFKPAAWLLKLLGMGGASTAAGVVGSLPGRIIKGGGIGGAALSLAQIMKHDSQNGNELRTWLRAQLGIEDPGEAAPWADSNAVNPGTQNMERRAWGYTDDTADAAAAGSGRDSAEVREARIRSLAKMLGVDPDKAVAVAKSEGFGSFKSAIPGEQSFGDFQLHVTPGGRGHAVGDQFREQTGLDPSDPANEAASDLFALQHAARNGWHDFHGAARVGIGDREGLGGVHIDSLEVNVTTDSRNPRDHGRVAADALRSSLAKQIADNANSGQTRQ